MTAELSPLEVLAATPTPVLARLAQAPPVQRPRATSARAAPRTHDTPTPTPDELAARALQRGPEAAQWVQLDDAQRLPTSLRVEIFGGLTLVAATVPGESGAVLGTLGYDPIAQGDQQRARCYWPDLPSAYVQAMHVQEHRAAFAEYLNAGQIPTWRPATGDLGNFTAGGTGPAAKAGSWSYAQDTPGTRRPQRPPASRPSHLHTPAPTLPAVACRTRGTAQRTYALARPDGEIIGHLTIRPSRATTCRAEWQPATLPDGRPSFQVVPVTRTTRGACALHVYGRGSRAIGAATHTPDRASVAAMLAAWRAGGTVLVRRIA